MYYRFSRTLQVVALLLTGMFAVNAHASGDFALLDQHGQFHQLSRYAEHDAVVMLVIAADEPTSSRAMAALQQVRQQLTRQAPDARVPFFLLYGEADPERAAVQAMAETQGIDFPVLLDDAQIVLTTLAAQQLGEVFILDPGSQDVLFRGALGASGADGEMQRGQVQQALADSLTGNSIASEAMTASGPDIDYHYRRQLEAQPISYQNDIAPLLQRRCAHCHVEQGLAPWAMNRHLMVLGWSPMIREVVITRRMPPGQIDGYVGDWQQTHELPPEELAMLIHWIDQGAPQDGDVDPLAEPAADLASWPLGEPDLVVDVPEQALPATGIVDFLLESAELSLSENRWLRAVAYDVGDKSVLHSLMIYARDRDAPVIAEADLIDPEVSDYVSIFVPGERVDAFPEGSAYLLEAGRELAFKIRYLTSGRETVDRTRIGLYFQDEAPEMIVDSIVLANDTINIPAGAAEHREMAHSEPLATDVYLTSLSPHAHGRARSTQLTAIYPDGDRELIANVANYNFNWQLTYRLRQPLLLPAGSRLEAETVYDNSLGNPLNADPTVSVQWGLSDQDEMFNHYVRILRPR
ncbi:hypothetical protein [Pseudohongiella sp.]|uniref:Uncharacterized protein n=1 Tax=marine sediment metagenome TaxID=412755 RepID=A0A0F9WEG1_9ZZZZ|nr:hypothetical protein [Pseudohongiella sp.]HDZ08391.1 hypothetical protein [Pseudohongiella sp.]HEA62756.1 hypothetical protein [Pseudohongiella sp.]